MELRSVIAALLLILAPALIHADKLPAEKLAIATGVWGPNASGSFCAVTIANGKVELNVPIHSDVPKVRTFPGISGAFVLNGLGVDSIQVIDPVTGSVLSNPSVERGSNPMDLIVVRQTDGRLKGYVSRLESPSMLVIPDLMNDASTKAKGHINLSTPIDATDHTPEMGGMLHLPDRATILVLLKTLDRGYNGHWLPVGAGRIAVIDTRDDSARLVNLRGANPLGEPKLSPNGTLYVAGTGVSSSQVYQTARPRFENAIRRQEKPHLDGILERLDPLTYQSLGLVRLEERLEGEIVAWDILDDRTGVASLVNADYSNPKVPIFAMRVVAFELATGKVTKEIIKSTVARDQAYPAMAVDRAANRLYVARRSERLPGILPFDLTNLESAGEEIRTVLPPTAFTLIRP